MEAIGESIGLALRPVVGRSLIQSRRIVDLQAFGFGEWIRRPAVGRKAPRFVDVPEFALHVQCRWRIVRDGSIVVGSADIFWPSSVARH